MTARPDPSPAALAVARKWVYHRYGGDDHEAVALAREIDALRAADMRALSCKSFAVGTLYGEDAALDWEDMVFAAARERGIPLDKEGRT